MWVGSAIFSAAVSVGTKLKDWKINPSRSRWSSVIWRSESSDSAVPPIYASPDVNPSSPAIVCMSVDFPDPDGPIIAVKVLRSNSTFTPSSAVTTVSP